MVVLDLVFNEGVDDGDDDDVVVVVVVGLDAAVVAVPDICVD